MESNVTVLDQILLIFKILGILLLHIIFFYPSPPLFFEYFLLTLGSSLPNSYTLCSGSMYNPYFHLIYFIKMLAS